MKWSSYFVPDPYLHLHLFPVTLIRRFNSTEILFHLKLAIFEFTNQHVQDYMVIGCPHGFGTVANRNGLIAHGIDNFFLIQAA